MNDRILDDPCIIVRRHVYLARMEPQQKMGLQTIRCYVPGNDRDGCFVGDGTDLNMGCACVSQQSVKPG